MDIIARIQYRLREIDNQLEKLCRAGKYGNSQQLEEEEARLHVELARERCRVAKQREKRTIIMTRHNAEPSLEEDSKLRRAL